MKSLMRHLFRAVGPPETVAFDDADVVAVTCVFVIVKVHVCVIKHRILNQIKLPIESEFSQLSTYTLDKMTISNRQGIIMITYLFRSLSSLAIVDGQIDYVV